jgi:TM2 domain-containing membrane protein YozV
MEGKNTSFLIFIGIIVLSILLWISFIGWVKMIVQFWLMVYDALLIMS